MYRDDSDFASGEFSTTMPAPAVETRRRPWFLPYKDDTKRLLIAAYALIRQGWVKGGYATDQNDCRTEWYADDAYNFCAMGAIMRANLKMQTPICLGWYWRRLRYDGALRAMCLAIDAGNNAETIQDRFVLIEKWNDYAHYMERNSGFEIAIAIA